ncbi:MAG: 50S ribosomal protein L6 [Phycisphaerales bacterium]|nr:50S ribosomal protein L6 [Phycisphaerales bacterium]
MSRIGKKPIPVPTGVTVTIKGDCVTIESGKNKLEMTHHPEVSVTWDEQEKHIVCTIDDADVKNKKIRAQWGTVRALLNNMVAGVTKGFSKKLEVVGVGWSPKLEGANLTLEIGYCHPVIMPIPAGLDVKVERQIITVSGIDKHLVGQFAADVRSKRKPEPYKGKGIKYTDEVILRKPGKAFGA